MQDRQDERLCLLLDSWSRLIARGKLESSLEGQNLQVQVLDGMIEEAVTHEVIQVVGMEGNEISVKCRLQRCRNDRIMLEKLEVVDAQIRQNLRIPVKFETLIYPVSGSWKGRRKVCSIDLSCGGIAFYGAQGLEKGEVLEIVIPITEQALILPCQILRQQELQNGRIFYAAKFVNLCHDEDRMVRKAVFSVQLKDGHDFIHTEGNQRRKGTE